MPPQTQDFSHLSDADKVKLVGSSQFQALDAETQLEVRKQLGLVTQRRPLPPEKPPQGLIMDLADYMQKTAETREREDINDPSRTMAGRFERQVSPRIMSDLLRTYSGMTSGKGLGLTAAGFVPQLRPLVGAYMAEQGGKELFQGRKPNESDADYLQRTLFALSGIAGGAALGKAGRGGPRGEMERRVGKATASIGAPAEAPTAFKLTLPDLAETMDQTGIRPKSVADVARLVEATNSRFNTRMALAEQPFAGDQLVPTKAVNELNNAAQEEQLAGNRAGARALRAKAIEYSKPMSLREIGARMRRFNSLYYKYSGKTALETTSAQSRGEALEIDVLRKALRDTYVDYLESKYHSPEFRDMRLRQEQILNLRDHLGEFNKRTGAFGKGFVQKLEADQMKFKYGSFTEPTGTVVSEHGARTYLRLPQFMKRGPQTKANIRAREAFGEGLGEGTIPRRKLKPLVRRTPPAGPVPPVAGPREPQGGPGVPPGEGTPPGASGAPGTPPGTPPANRPGQRPSPPPSPEDTIQFHRMHRQPDLRAQLKVAKAAGDAEWVKRVENQIEISEKLVKDARERLSQKARK